MKLQALQEFACQVAARFSSHPIDTIRKIANGDTVDGIDPATIQAIAQLIITVMEAAAELFQNCPAPAARWAQAVRNMTPVGRVAARVSIRRTCKECNQANGGEIARTMLDIAPTFDRLDAALGEIAAPFDFIYG